MKIGLDLHWCIDLYPEIFSRFSKSMIANGNEIHIITGQRWEEVKGKVDKAGVVYTHHFSIVDYHLGIGTYMQKDEKGTYWMDERIWVRSKGGYMAREHIDLHFDDSVEYARHVPPYTTYILVPKKNFGIISILFDI